MILVNKKGEGPSNGTVKETLMKSYSRLVAFVSIFIKTLAALILRVWIGRLGFGAVEFKFRRPRNQLACRRPYFGPLPSDWLPK